MLGQVSSSPQAGCTSLPPHRTHASESIPNEFWDMGSASTPLLTVVVERGQLFLPPTPPGGVRVEGEEQTHTLCDPD